MPVTLAHPAAVLPLRRLGLPMSAMVIGSMVPDVPLFLSWAGGYQLAHSMLGVLTADLAVALVLVATWDVVARDALVDLAPGAVRDRLPEHRRLSGRQWLQTPAAAVLGSTTHVLWDAFTHQGRWGVSHVAWLQADAGPLPGFRWAQYLSGAAGLVLVLAACTAYLRTRSPRGTSRPRRLPAQTLPLAVSAATGYGLLAGLVRFRDGMHAVAFHGAVGSIIALAGALTILCLVWLLAARRGAPAW